VSDLCRRRVPGRPSLASHMLPACPSLEVLKSTFFFLSDGVKVWFCALVVLWMCSTEISRSRDDFFPPCLLFLSIVYGCLRFQGSISFVSRVLPRCCHPSTSLSIDDPECSEHCTFLAFLRFLFSLFSVYKSPCLPPGLTRFPFSRMAFFFLMIS